MNEKKKENRISLRTKITLLFSLIAAISIIAVGVYSIFNAMNTAVEKERFDTKHNLEFVDYKINEIIDAHHKEALELANDVNVAEYLSSGFANGNEFEFVTRRKMLSYYTTESITGIKLVDLNGNVLSYSPKIKYTFENYNDISAVPEIASQKSNSGYEAWQDACWDDREPVIPYVRTIRDAGKENNRGFLIVNVQESIFNEIYAPYETGSSTAYYIVNSNGTIQSSTNQNFIGKNIWDEFKIELSQAGMVTGNFEIKNYWGRYLVTYQHDNSSGLYLFALTPYSAITEDVMPIIWSMIIVMLVCVAACVIASLLISRSVTNPINALIEKIADLGYEYADRRDIRNEIEILNKQYEGLVSDLNVAVDKSYSRQQKRKDAEIRALELQITPHFLYNTLSTIIWQIEQNEPKKAIDLIKKLSSFYRISTSGGKRFISIKDELKHVGVYIDLQNARYGDRIVFESSVPAELFEYYVPKLILQPLVENSIKHAVHDDQEHIGEIEITGYENEEAVYLEVIDNGDSVTEEQLEEMNDFLHYNVDAEVSEKFGIGIKNVNDRIAMNFGEKYGLSYRRENDRTVASLKLRKMKRENIQE